MRNIKFLLILILAVFISACENSQNQSRINKENETKNSQVIKPELVLKGESYSDSMMKIIIKESLPKEKIKIDTSKSLKGITCDVVQGIENYYFTMDSVRKYKEILKPVTNTIKEVLHVSHCFSNFKNTEKFNSFIFFSQFHESHYSASFDLITIQKESNTINRIKLVSEYGNEQGDYTISTKIRDDLNFVRTINHNFRYIHGIGKVDSSLVKKEYYTISNEGIFTLTNTIVEN